METPEERTFDSYAEYRAAVLEALTEAQQTVAIFDPDLRDSGLENQAAVALLEALCGRSRRTDAVRILLHSTAWLEKECPRLLRLLARYGHCARVRTTPPGARGWKQPFLCVDGQRLVTRFHQDLPKGKICASASTTTAYFSTQFETFWTSGDDAAVGVPLGI